MSRMEAACLLIAPDVAAARSEWRTDGLNPAQIEDATERLVRDKLRDFVPDERFWPVQYTLPRCAYCDGCGLVLRRNVRNKLGLMVDVGEPCRCPKGMRFYPKESRHDDYTSAGKVQKQPARFGK